MNEKQATNLITQGKALVVKSAARIRELETSTSALTTKVAAAEKQAKAVAALGDRIADAMIKAGAAKPADRAKIIKNLADPVKLAGELINTLERATVPTTGSVDHTTDASGEKKADRRSQSDVDNAYRARCGLTGA